MRNPARREAGFTLSNIFRQRDDVGAFPLPSSDFPRIMTLMGHTRFNGQLTS